MYRVRCNSDLRPWLLVIQVNFNFAFFNLNINQLDALNFIISLFQACTCSSTCAHRQEVVLVLYNLWYHHTCRWPPRAQDSNKLVNIKINILRCTVSKISTFNFVI